jgi:hypothetical protein
MKRHRCSATTKKGLQCSSYCPLNKKYCGKHKSLMTPDPDQDPTPKNIVSKKIKSEFDEKSIDSNTDLSPKFKKTRITSPLDTLAKYIKSKIQKNRLLTTNDHDPFTLELIKDISIGRLYLIKDNNHFYGFDIKNLGIYIKKDNKNPFTLKAFTDKEINKINKYYNIFNLNHTTQKHMNFIIVYNYYLGMWEKRL